MVVHFVLRRCLFGDPVEIKVTHYLLCADVDPRKRQRLGF